MSLPFVKLSSRSGLPDSLELQLIRPHSCDERTAPRLHMSEDGGRGVWRHSHPQHQVQPDESASVETTVRLRGRVSVGSAPLTGP